MVKNSQVSRKVTITHELSSHTNEGSKRRLSSGMERREASCCWGTTSWELSPPLAPTFTCDWDDTSSQLDHFFFCLSWIKKERVKDKTYIWVSVWCVWLCLWPSVTDGSPPPSGRVMCDHYYLSILMYTPGMSVMSLLLKNRYESKRIEISCMEKEKCFCLFLFS